MSVQLSYNHIISHTSVVGFDIALIIILCRRASLQCELLYTENNDFPIIYQVTDTQLGSQAIPLFSLFIFANKNDIFTHKIIFIYLPIIYKINHLASDILHQVKTSM